MTETIKVTGTRESCLGDFREFLEKLPHIASHIQLLHLAGELPRFTYAYDDPAICHHALDKIISGIPHLRKLRIRFFSNCNCSSLTSLGLELEHLSVDWMYFLFVKDLLVFLGLFSELGELYVGPDAWIDRHNWDYRKMGQKIKALSDHIPSHLRMRALRIGRSRRGLRFVLWNVLPKMTATHTNCLRQSYLTGMRSLLWENYFTLPLQQSVISNSPRISAWPRVENRGGHSTSPSARNCNPFLPSLCAILPTWM
ncbi:hypothetical protein BKA93DRAFT_585621 [Sparassis latifolia]